MKIVRGKLTSDDIIPPNQRYDVSCDCTQSLINGSWVNNPNIDPRTSAGYLLPVPTRTNPRCESATGIINNFRDGLNQVINALDETGNVAAGASVLLTLLDFLTGVGLLIQLFIDFCTLILSIGTAGVSAAFTDPVYHQLQCLLDCDSLPDGTWDATTFAKLQADVTSSFGALSDVNLVFQGWLANVGYIGLSNIGTVKTSTGGDCSDCLCCDCTTFTVPTGAIWAAIPEVPGFTFFDGAGMYTTLDHPNLNAAAMDCSTIAPAGSYGWAVALTSTGGSIIPWMATDVGTPTTNPGDLTDIATGGGACVLIPASHPILGVTWTGSTIRITGWCVNPA